MTQFGTAFHCLRSQYEYYVILVSRGQLSKRKLPRRAKIDILLITEFNIIVHLLDAGGAEALPARLIFSRTSALSETDVRATLQQQQSKFAVIIASTNYKKKKSSGRPSSPNQCDRQKLRKIQTWRHCRQRMMHPPPLT